MALLDATNRARTAAQWMRDQLEPCAFTKADLRAAVDATDAWIDSAQGAAAPSTGYNSALPVAFRNNATTTQKTVLFCYVAMRRAGLLRAQED